MSKRRSLERWKEMADLGADVDFKGDFLPVTTQAQAKAFFQEILSRYDARNVVSRPEDHRWLVWLLGGYYDIPHLCPAGPHHFTVHANRDIGHTGKDKGFSVVGNGASAPVPFAYMRALRGVPKTLAEKTTLALQRSVAHQIEHWLDVTLRQGARCPVTHVELIRGVNVYVEYEHTFEAVEQSFYKERGYPSDFLGGVVAETDCGSHFTWSLAETDLLRDWRQYHWQRSRFCAVSIVGHYMLVKKQLEQAREQETLRATFLNMRS